LLPVAVAAVLGLVVVVVPEEHAKFLQHLFLPGPFL
jgi:hypothetical protein